MEDSSWYTIRRAYHNNIVLIFRSKMITPYMIYCRIYVCIIPGRVGWTVHQYTQDHLRGITIQRGEMLQRLNKKHIGFKSRRTKRAVMISRYVVRKKWGWTPKKLYSIHCNSELNDYLLDSCLNRQTRHSRHKIPRWICMSMTGQ